MRTRLEITEKYLSGHGLEIAGLHNPWPMNPDSKSIQLDLYTTEELYAQYPEHKNNKLIRVQIIDDGSKCESIASNSMDFVVSSHVLEHCENVIKTIENWLRITKPGGIITMAVPHHTNPMDYKRKVTPLTHFWEEYTKGLTLPNQRDHYEDYFSLVDNLEGTALQKRIEDAMVTFPHIHFHTFSENSLLELLVHLSCQMNFEILHHEFVVHEMLTVLKKN